MLPLLPRLPLAAFAQPASPLTLSHCASPPACPSPPTPLSSHRRRQSKRGVKRSRSASESSSDEGDEAVAGERKQEVTRDDVTRKVRGLKRVHFAPPSRSPSLPPKRPRTSPSTPPPPLRGVVFADPSDTDPNSPPRSRSASPTAAFKPPSAPSTAHRPSPLQQSFSLAPDDREVLSVATRLLKVRVGREVEGVGEEVRAVFALVHGRGLGMGIRGRGGKGSGLRPKEREEEEEKAEKGSKSWVAWEGMELDG